MTKEHKGSRKQLMGDISIPEAILGDGILTLQIIATPHSMPER